MGRVVRTRPARKDLLQVWSHIARESVAAADRLLDRLDEKCQLYAAKPLLGQLRSDLGASVRCFRVDNYVAFYRPVEGGIQLLLVTHGSRDIPSLYRERFGET